jgi:DNA modification methylase
VEFGGGVLDKIIRRFCDSPFLTTQNYAQTLHELVETFYHAKGETMDMVSDDDLIQFMKLSFDGVCQGSVDLLANREVYLFAKNLRFGGQSDEDIHSLEDAWDSSEYADDEEEEYDDE